mmetsp:Transcript_18158/g.42190  ORF Transcript_18158/g.42190 Transcript_18158/m.42190 type:complete len:791 (+) Transcript_18158:49-2421(+)
MAQYDKGVQPSQWQPQGASTIVTGTSSSTTPSRMRPCNWSVAANAAAPSPFAWQATAPHSSATGGASGSGCYTVGGQASQATTATTQAQEWAQISRPPSMSPVRTVHGCVRVQSPQRLQPVGRQAAVTAGRSSSPVRQQPGFLRAVTPVKSGSPARIRWAAVPQSSPIAQVRPLVCGTPSTHPPRWLSGSTGAATASTATGSTDGGLTATTNATDASSGAGRREEVLRAQLSLARQQLANSAGEVARLEAELLTAQDRAGRDRSIAEAAAALHRSSSQSGGSMLLPARSQSPAAGESGTVPAADAPPKLGSSASTPILPLGRSGSAAQLVPPRPEAMGGVMQYAVPVMRSSIPSMGRLFAESDIAVDVSLQEASASSVAATGSRDSASGQGEHDRPGQMEQLADKVANEILSMAFQEVPAVALAKMWSLQSHLASLILSVTRDRARIQARGQQYHSPERQMQELGEQQPHEAFNFDALWSVFEQAVRHTCSECNMDGTAPLLLSTVRMALTLQPRAGDSDGSSLEAAVARLAGSRGSPSAPGTVVTAAAGPTVIPKVKLPAHPAENVVDERGAVQRHVPGLGGFPRIQGARSLAYHQDRRLQRPDAGGFVSGGSSQTSSLSDLSPVEIRSTPPSRPRSPLQQLHDPVHYGGETNGAQVSSASNLEDLAKFAPVERPIGGADVDGFEHSMDEYLAASRRGSGWANAIHMHPSSGPWPADKRSASRGEATYATETRASRGKVARPPVRDRSRRQDESSVAAQPVAAQPVAMRAVRSPLTNGRSPNGRASRWR